jgi:hypothetical protein
MEAFTLCILRVHFSDSKLASLNTEASKPHHAEPSPTVHRIALPEQVAAGHFSGIISSNLYSSSKVRRIVTPVYKRR